jgi:hypothetical protein
MAATVAALVAEGDTGADADTVLQNDADATAGAIVRTGDNGFVSVSYYDNKREFDRAWQRIEEDCAEEEDEED